MVAVAQEEAQVKVGGSVPAPPSLDANLGQDISPTLHHQSMNSRYKDTKHRNSDCCVVRFAV